VRIFHTHVSAVLDCRYADTVLSLLITDSEGRTDIFDDRVDLKFEPLREAPVLGRQIWLCRLRCEHRRHAENSKEKQDHESWKPYESAGPSTSSR
jgi:hypothetical protein